MTDSEPVSPQDAIDVRQLANAVRWIIFVVVIGFSWYNFGLARSIPHFHLVFSEMLGGKPLPLVTEIVVAGSSVFLAVAAIIPAVALGALLTRRIVTGIYVLGALGLLILIEVSFVLSALSSPLLEIIRQMGGAP